MFGNFTKLSKMVGNTHHNIQFFYKIGFSIVSLGDQICGFCSKNYPLAPENPFFSGRHFGTFEEGGHFAARFPKKL